MIFAPHDIITLMWDVSALVTFARQHGVAAAEPAILRDRSNLLVHLAPAPVVARIPAKVLEVRTDPVRYLRTDLELATFLHAVGEPVVAPSAELPAGPHLIDGRWCTFWTYQPHSGQPGTADELRAGVERMHAALLDFPGDLRERGPLADLRLALGRWSWTEAERATLTARIAEFAAELAELPAQPLHGDAHSGNALRTPHGLRWTDFEDAWCGPREWDLACLAEGRLPVPPVRRSPAFELCLRLRHAHTGVWGQVLRPGTEYAANARARLLGR